jgi:hypothetical protein
MKLLTYAQLMWFATIMTTGLAGFWLVWDLFRLRRFWPKGRAAHDEIFGSIIGITIALMGLIGVVGFHLG